MTRIAVLGATGYTALELIKILLRHPEAEIVAVTSRQEGQPRGGLPRLLVARVSYAYRMAPGNNLLRVNGS